MPNKIPLLIMKHRFIFLFFLLLGTAVSISAQQSSYETAIPKWRFSVSGGMGYSFVSGNSSNYNSLNADKMKKYEDDARWSSLLNADVHYFFKPDWGLGIKYLINRTSTSGNDFIEDIGDGRHYAIGNISDNVFLNYVGPSVAGYHKFGAEKKFMLFSAASIGYAHYRDEIKYINYNYLVTGNTVASTFEFGLEYFVKPSVSIGANIGYILANFYSIKTTDGSRTETSKLDSDNRLNASNVNLSLGIRYYLNK